LNIAGTSLFLQRSTGGRGVRRRGTREVDVGGNGERHRSETGVGNASPIWGPGRLVLCGHKVGLHGCPHRRHHPQVRPCVRRTIARECDLARVRRPSAIELNSGRALQIREAGSCPATSASLRIRIEQRCGRDALRAGLGSTPDHLHDTVRPAPPAACLRRSPAAENRCPLRRTAGVLRATFYVCCSTK
jgi:hypothetical protein